MCITVHYGFTYLCMQCFMCQKMEIAIWNGKKF
ncbi:hypothetical protein T4A_4065 [Trichinella pseudospiralis]|uniref:Uncharacterized protein n=1 Tax=Trichinella pseudospiralis TaxID=6337 RepID=A0A0V1DNJ6_TRIPS|nr:hypothetical protein T4A_4065 [Trichinella pseudospiralis]